MSAGEALTMALICESEMTELQQSPLPRAFFCLQGNVALQLVRTPYENELKNRILRPRTASH